MYLEHFGLQKQPFRAVAQGDTVFVGPRQARALANLKIALAMPDAIAAVTGPVGVGKTTLVGRVLDLIAANRSVARVGRTPMTVDELLEHLLAEFGISGTGAGRMERLRTLRSFFKDCGAGGVRAFILVEDAKTLDTRLLAELETVTAADADGSPGANVILMGPAVINDLIDSPQLEHLRQRTRLRQQLEPLDAGEIAGYVKHLLETAGGDFQTIVDPQTPQTLRHCTGGIPRIVNNLCETAFTVAATNKMPNLPPHLVQRVAITIYGIQPRAADGATPQVTPKENMQAPASEPLASEAAADLAEVTAALTEDPEPTIVEEDLPAEMLEAADALADFEPEHPAEVTQDITEVPAPAQQADDEISGPEPTLTDDPMASAEDPQSEAVSAAADGQSVTDPAPVDAPMMDAAFESDAEIPAAEATPDEPMLETAAIPDTAKPEPDPSQTAAETADADAEPAAVEGASDTAIMANAALLMSHEAALAAQAEAAEEARSDADAESAAANVASSTEIMVNVAAELMAHEEALAEQAEAALNDDRATAPGPEPDPALVAASVDEPEPDTSLGTVGQDPQPAAEGDDEAPMLDLDWASETQLSIAEDAPADPAILPAAPPTGALDPLLATQTAQAQLTESTRIKSLSILDELGELEIAAAQAKDPMSDVPPTQSGSGGSEGIDWSTWPVASEEQNPSETAAPESEMAPALESKPDPEPVAEPDQIEMATPQAIAPATRPDPILAPVVGSLEMPPAQAPTATPAATAQPTIPAAPSQAPLAAPPTLTDVEPEAPTAPLAPTEAQAPATTAKPPVAAEPVPPVLTEVFQVTPREPSPATETAAATPPPAEAKPSAATVAPQAPSVPATPPPAATTPAKTPASELDFSVLLEGSDSQIGLTDSDAPGGDVPVIVDPPALDPVDPELTNLAADVAQVTNLADLDELLAETLFGAEELEQLSAEIQAKQEAAQQPGAAAPAPPPAAPPAPAPSSTDTTKIERMAILAAMNGLGADDEDESGPKNAVG